jgi:hypothetical protein
MQCASIPRMNNAAVLAAFVISMLLVPFGVCFQTVKADSSAPVVFAGGVTIYSPVNATYSAGFLNLNLTFNAGAGVMDSLSYDIDGKYGGPISLVFNDTPGFHLFSLETGFVSLPGLSDGSHRLTIYVEADLNDYHGANPPGAPFEETAPGSANYAAKWVDIVDFAVETNGGKVDTASPIIVDLPAENQAYNTTDIPLNFTVDKGISQGAYSLDGKGNVTIDGNSTLTNLAVGEHDVTVYTWDDDGNVGASQAVNFTVVISKTNLPSPQAFPMILVMGAFVAFLVVVVLIILVYFKWKKR